MTDFVVKPLGTVSSSLKDAHSAPRQPDEDAPSAWLIFREEFAEALRSIKEGDELVLLTWLDRARRDALSVHPRGESSRAKEGVFSTRSPHRPNPIGLHRVTVSAIDRTRIQVRSLEALDGTPIIDVKPVLSTNLEER